MQLGPLVGRLARAAADALQQELRRRGRSAAPAPRASRPGGVDVEYAPSMDGDADPGEVVWTWVPFEDDPSQGKDRPVLVLGYVGGRLAAVPLTSKRHPERRDQLPVGTGGWDPRRRPSYADVGRLLRLERRAVRREGSAIDRAVFDAVVAAARARYPELSAA
ncbi:MAG: type II toxin-antitoxin system PemK/MazF family toxin [Thermoleophilia bacterium]|nr:type II toxin-antitoxin system PemK/MazF family toxin [Thermoleophilia bacterium]